jgi:KDO2-lipid IV(A) lauroyltransferase
VSGAEAVGPVAAPGEPSSGSLREEAAYQAYRLAAWLSRSLPPRAGAILFGLLGRAGHALMPGLRATVTANQAQVLGLPPEHPTVRASTREAFHSYARYWHETFRIPLLPVEEFLARTDIVGYEHVEAALSQGRGVICVLPHLGNWDAGGRYMTERGLRVVSVAEELRPERLFRLFVEHREALGLDILGLSRDAQVGRRLASALAENRMVALVADRDLTGRGVEVPMFGRPRRLPAGPALLSLTTGAPILVSPVYQIPGGWRIVFSAPLEIDATGERRRDVAALTRRMGEAFERAISAAPADWHLFQPAWEP